MSPSHNLRLGDGIPWTISLFTEVHSMQGYPRYPLNAARPGLPAIFSSANFSRSIVVMPGLTALRSAVKRSEEHTSELQSQSNLVCRLLLEKKNTTPDQVVTELIGSIRRSCLIALP